MGRVGWRIPRFWAKQGRKSLIFGSGTQFHVQMLFFWHSGLLLLVLCSAAACAGAALAALLPAPAVLRKREPSCVCLL